MGQAFLPQISGNTMPEGIKGIRLVGKRSFVLNASRSGGSTNRAAYNVDLSSITEQSPLEDGPIYIFDNVTITIANIKLNDGYGNTTTESVDSGTWTLYLYNDNKNSSAFYGGGKYMTTTFGNVKAGDTITYTYPAPFIYGAIPKANAAVHKGYWVLLQDWPRGGYYLDATVTFSGNFYEYKLEV